MKILNSFRQSHKQKKAEPVPTKALDAKHLSLSKQIETLLCDTTHVLYSPDLDQLVVTGYMKRDENYQISTYDGKNFNLLRTVKVRKAAIYKAILLPQALLATISVDQTLKIWRLADLSLVSQIRVNYMPQDVCVNPNLPGVILVGKSSCIKCYCPKTGHLLGEMFTESQTGFSSCVYLCDKNVVAAGVYGQHTIHFIDCRTSLTLNKVEAEHQIDSITSITNMQFVGSQYLVTASTDLITVWDIKSLSHPKKHAQIVVPLKKIASFHVIEEYDMIFVASLSSVVDIYRLSDGTLLKFLPTKMLRCSEVTFARATRKLLVADNSDGVISIFTDSYKFKPSCHTCNIF